MLKLTLLRHAKSSWAYPWLDDFLRPLNERGYRQAEGLTENFPSDVDAIWCSPAIRAYTTASSLLRAEHQSDECLSLKAEIYQASASGLATLLREASCDHLVLIGHNPELEILAEYLTDTEVELKTAHLLQLKLNCESWRLIGPDCAQVVSLWRPDVGKKVK